MLNPQPDDVSAHKAVEHRIARTFRTERRIAELESAQLALRAPEIASAASAAGAVTLAAAEVGAIASSDDLRTLALAVRDRLGEAPAVVALGGTSNDKPVVLVATNAGARDAGVKAGALVRTAAQVLGGGGGGRDDVAQGGGQDPAKLAEALTAVARQLGS